MTLPIRLLAPAGFAVGAGMRILDPLLPMMAREFGVGLGAAAPLIRWIGFREAVLTTAFGTVLLAF